MWRSPGTRRRAGRAPRPAARTPARSRNRCRSRSVPRCRWSARCAGRARSFNLKRPTNSAAMCWASAALPPLPASRNLLPARSACVDDVRDGARSSARKAASPRRAFERSKRSLEMRCDEYRVTRRRLRLSQLVAPWSACGKRRQVVRRSRPRAAPRGRRRRLVAGISRMQRWCCMRQVGLWQGRHGTSVLVSITAASGLSGAQCHGLVGPKMPTVGVPIAAATCTSPESLETRRSAAASARMALRRSSPVRSRAPAPAAATILRPAAFSPGPPSTQTSRPCAARACAASA